MGPMSSLEPQPLKPYRRGLNFKHLQPAGLKSLHEFRREPFFSPMPPKP